MPLGDWANSVAQSKDQQTGLTPSPAKFHVEPIVEFPAWEELPRQLQSQFRKWSPEDELIDPPIADGAELYSGELSCAPGSKVGGYPHWMFRDNTPDCRCGIRMVHLLTLASAEYLKSGGRWGWGKSNATNPRKEATGLDIPKFGKALFFYCVHCPRGPLDLLVESW